MPSDGGMAASGRSAGSRVFTVPAGCPFLPILAEAILKGDLPFPGGGAPDPLDLPEVTILLPTRRAARALQQAFLDASGGRAMLLPKIRPIAEAEEDLTLLSSLSRTAAGADPALEIPPAVSELERRLVLTELVLRWSEAMRTTEEQADGTAPPYAAAGATTPAQAAGLARELAGLIDMVETEGADITGLAGLAPDSFSEHWQKTLGFLKIVLDWWPQHLAERGLISPMERRNRLIGAEATRYVRHPPSGPVIVAGVTGSIPATAELMRAVLGLRQGCIVLPGLDLCLDPESWALLDRHPEHPQHGLAKLLARLGIRRGDVALLGIGRPGEAAGADRAALVGEALRPAATTDAWRRFISGADRDRIRRGLAGVACIEAANAHEEAEAIALILREALEQPGRTAALVSPDRLLARRVAVRLEAWGIRVDDSAGLPFGKTVPGTFLDLVIDAMAQDFAPPATMALLRHPLTRLGSAAGSVRRAARALELIAFRTDYLGRGLDGIEAALENAARQLAAGSRRHRAVTRLWEADWQAARDLATRLRAAFAPLDACWAGTEPRDLVDLVRAHVTVAESLARLPDSDPPATGTSSPLWDGEAGEAASLLLSGLLDPGLRAPRISPVDYPDFYRSLVAGETIRPRLPVHPRLSIWGPFEARLQNPDVIVLGSLNEGTWPETADAGPWMNRPMRESLGLPQPETRVGHAAHDFAQFITSPTVYLTRAVKVDGAPTVPSRWLLRLRALVDGMGIGDVLTPEWPWLGWARARNAAPPQRRIAAPAPCPPVALRPRKLSVSDVERWIANPYAIFAKSILGLEPLPHLGAEPGATLRGKIVHEALSRFARIYPTTLPAEPAAEFMQLAQEILVEYTGNPRVAAFWVPRLERFARWFGATELERRRGVAQILAEVSGARVLDAPAGPFTLTARADRIDARGDGLVITDYKTGRVDKLASRAAKGFAPQLPLEAAIALEAGFESLDTARVAELRYISASGAEPPGIQQPINSDDVNALAGAAIDGLKRLVCEFDRPTTPYRAVIRAVFDQRFDDYAHLARAAEWQGGEPDGDDE